MLPILLPLIVFFTDFIVAVVDPGESSATRWDSDEDGLSEGELVLIGSAPQPGQRVRIDSQVRPMARVGSRTKEDAGAALSNAMGR